MVPIMIHIDLDQECPLKKEIQGEKRLKVNHKNLF